MKTESKPMDVELNTCIEKLHEIAGFFFKKAKGQASCNWYNSEIMMERRMTVQIAAKLLSLPTPSMTPEEREEVMEIMVKSLSKDIGCWKGADLAGRLLTALLTKFEIRRKG